MKKFALAAIVAAASMMFASGAMAHRPPPPPRCHTFPMGRGYVEVICSEPCPPLTPQLAARFHLRPGPQKGRCDYVHLGLSPHLVHQAKVWQQATYQAGGNWCLTQFVIDAMQIRPNGGPYWVGFYQYTQCANPIQIAGGSWMTYAQKGWSENQVLDGRTLSTNNPPVYLNPGSHVVQGWTTITLTGAPDWVNYVTSNAGGRASWTTSAMTRVRARSGSPCSGMTSSPTTCDDLPPHIGQHTRAAVRRDPITRA